MNGFCDGGFLDFLGVCVCGREKREKRVECGVRSGGCLGSAYVGFSLVTVVGKLI